MTISHDLFDSCCEAMGLKVTEEAFLKFDAYAEMLIAYNEKVNLTAITAPDEIVVKHFIDSLALLNYVKTDAGTSLCDVGTGAGFPGMALKIACPGLQVTLCDSIHKKLEFIRFLCKELAIDAKVVTIRAEDAGRNAEYRERFDIVTARAVAALNKLSEYCIPLVRVGGAFAPMKAMLSQEEEQQGFGAAANLGAKLKQKCIYTLPDESQREILIFEKISQTNAKYPRNSAQISKKPL